MERACSSTAAEAEGMVPRVWSVPENISLQLVILAPHGLFPGITGSEQPGHLRLSFPGGNTCN